MNFWNSKTFDPHRLLLNLSNKANLRENDKYFFIKFQHILLLKNIEKSSKNNLLKTYVPKWNDKFQLLDGSYSVSNIQHYFEYIIKKHEIVTDNLQ